MIPDVGKIWTDDDIRRAACEEWGRLDLWKRYLGARQNRKPFISDGPSCCPRYIICGGKTIDLYPAAAEHDLAYYIGGSENDRFREDLRLAENVVFRCGGTPEIAMTMLNAVRLGGTDKLPTSWRWGFGGDK